jgi:hypothetical protein
MFGDLHIFVFSSPAQLPQENPQVWGPSMQRPEKEHLLIYVLWLVGWKSVNALPRPSTQLKAAFLLGMVRMWHQHPTMARKQLAQHGKCWTPNGQIHLPKGSWFQSQLSFTIIALPAVAPTIGGLQWNLSNNNQSNQRHWHFSWNNDELNHNFFEASQIAACQNRSILTTPKRTPPTWTENEWNC